LNIKTLAIAAATLATAIVCGDAHADDQRVSFGVDARAGVQYDSNVGIVELDDNSGEPDQATALAAAIDATIRPGKPVSLRFGYDYADTAYRRFSEFDLTLHHAVAALKFSNQCLDAAVTVDRYAGILDSDRYLTLTQYSPSVSKLFGSRVFLRAAYTASSKNYDVLGTRSSTGSAVRLDSYLLLDGMNRYLSLAVQQSREDAVDPELDYHGMSVALAYGHRVTMPLLQLRLKAQVRYGQRDYLNNTESIDTNREDSRLRAAVAATIPFTDHIELECTVERTDNGSNLESAVIDKVIYRVGLAMQF